MTMRREVLVAAAMALAASGCGRTPFPVLETELGILKGQPAKAVFDKLGDPNGNEEIAGEKVYVWSAANNNSFPGAAANAIDFECTVRVFVDKKQNISHYDFKGNVAGCAPFAHRLDESYDLVHWNAS
jgi:hypothetical protein